MSSVRQTSEYFAINGQLPDDIATTAPAAVPGSKGFFNLRTPLFISNRVTPPGSRICRESGRISRGARGMSDKKGKSRASVQSPLSPDTYHDSFDWSEIQRT
jgi:hypothetical protein